MFSEIGQLAITVRDLEKSIRFYRDILGLTFLFKADPGLAFLKIGHTRLMLSQSEAESQPGSGIVIYLKTDDLESAFSNIQSCGGEGVEPPHLIAKMPDHDLWMAFCKDPDGYLVGMMEERKNQII